MSNVTVVIPVYKRLRAFSDYLLHNVTYLPGCSLVIVNDDPQSTLPRDLHIPENIAHTITWINHTKNVGFAGSVNDGVAQVKTDYIMLLNTDVKLNDTRWHHAHQYLETNSNVFAVSFAQKEKDGKLVGRNRLYFARGLYHHMAVSYTSPDTENPNLVLSTAWAEGGACIMRTSMWRMLGGFDTTYNPFYWEDVDLSYRARQRGWGVYLMPHVVVEHHHESTIGTEFDSKTIQNVAFQNQLYFTQKHAKGWRKLYYLWYKHIALPIQKMRKSKSQ